VTRSGAQHVRRLLEEEVDARQHALQLVARLGDRLADLGGEHLGEPFACSRPPARGSARSRQALLQPHARPAGCAARARAYFAATLFASSAGSVAATCPVAGFRP
jgi:hypothetical protein